MTSAGESHSIYVRNLPYDATDEQLHEVFKKFGPIKHEGIQVRSSKVLFMINWPTILLNKALLV